VTRIALAPLLVTQEELWQAVQRCAPHVDRKGFERMWRSNERRRARAERFAEQRRLTIRAVT
jgi:hypothetical protein